MSAIKALLPVTAAVLLALPMVGIAQDRGQNEVAGSLSYTDIADVSTTNIDLTYGRYLTPHHELGMQHGAVHRCGRLLHRRRPG